MPKSIKKIQEHILLLSLIFTAIYACSVEADNKNMGAMTVVSYNVENLFDTIDAPDKDDNAYLPSSSKRWTAERYKKKIDDIAHVIHDIDSTNYPILVGLSEIENDLVLQDLVNSSWLEKANYDFIWNDGPDIRGIDCALLYDRDRFKPINTSFLHVTDLDNNSFIGREIVYVSGKIEKEVFHIFVSHWVSRIGGAKNSEPKRILTANVIRSCVNSIYKNETNPNIIIMGDFNDEPIDPSVISVLRANPNNESPKSGELVNLMYNNKMQGEGTYKYQGEWNLLDNLIVSERLINKQKGIKTTLDNGYIFHLPYMEFTNSKGETSPKRTYGSYYFGGVSDHYPIYITLKQQNN